MLRNEPIWPIAIMKRFSKWNIFRCEFSVCETRSRIWAHQRWFVFLFLFFLRSLKLHSILFVRVCLFRLWFCKRRNIFHFRTFLFAWKHRIAQFHAWHPFYVRCETPSDTMFDYKTERCDGFAIRSSLSLHHLTNDKKTKKKKENGINRRLHRRRRRRRRLRRWRISELLEEWWFMSTYYVELLLY